MSFRDSRSFPERRRRTFRQQHYTVAVVLVLSLPVVRSLEQREGQDCNIDSKLASQCKYDGCETGKCKSAECQYLYCAAGDSCGTLPCDKCYTSGGSLCDRRPCEAGTFTECVEEKCSCTECPAGKFSIKTGVTNCTDCDAGKYSTITRATEATVCVDCVAGENVSIYVYVYLCIYIYVY
jgi:hypothetical protein